MIIRISEKLKIQGGDKFAATQVTLDRMERAQRCQERHSAKPTSF